MTSCGSRAASPVARGAVAGSRWWRKRARSDAVPVASTSSGAVAPGSGRTRPGGRPPSRIPARPYSGSGTAPPLRRSPPAWSGPRGRSPRGRGARRRPSAAGRGERGSAGRRRGRDHRRPAPRRGARAGWGAAYRCTPRRCPMRSDTDQPGAGGDQGAPVRGARAPAGRRRPGTIRLRLAPGPAAVRRARSGRRGRPRLPGRTAVLVLPPQHPDPVDPAAGEQPPAGPRPRQRGRVRPSRSTTMRVRGAEYAAQRVAVRQCGSAAGTGNHRGRRLRARWCAAYRGPRAALRQVEFPTARVQHELVPLVRREDQ